jgi:hypothetical protein
VEEERRQKKCAPFLAHLYETPLPYTYIYSLDSGTDITNPSSQITAHLLKHVCDQHHNIRVKKMISRILYTLNSLLNVMFTSIQHARWNIKEIQSLGT